MVAGRKTKLVRRRPHTDAVSDWDALLVRELSPESRSCQQDGDIRHRRSALQATQCRGSGANKSAATANSAIWGIDRRTMEWDLVQRSRRVRIQIGRASC